MKCTVDAAWANEEEQKTFIAKAKEMGVKATFHDGGDCFSTWTFEGPNESVKKIVENNFQITPNFMPFDTLVKCVEVGAIVDGKPRYDENFNDY